MPTYTYRCGVCNDVSDHFNTVEDRHKGPQCCGQMASKVLTVAQIAPVLGGGDFPGYRCPVTDQYVTSRKQRVDIMKRHNLQEAGDDSAAKRARREKVKAATG